MTDEILLFVCYLLWSSKIYLKVKLNLEEKIQIKATKRNVSINLFENPTKMHFLWQEPDQILEPTLRFKVYAQHKCFYLTIYWHSSLWPIDSKAEAKQPFSMLIASIGAKRTKTT